MAIHKSPIVQATLARRATSWREWVARIASFLACGMAASTSVATNITHDVAYGSSPSQRLDVYRPAASLSPERAVVLIHGGGWVSGDKGDYRSIGMRAAEKGIVAVAINYRLANGSRQNMWPSQLEDAQTAVKWVADHANDIGVDPRRICISGNSAGGQLALLLAVSVQPKLPRILCVVDEFGPADLIKFFQEPPANLFGSADPATLRRAMETASPVNLVTAAMPPTLIIQGSEDTVVKPDQSEGLRAALVRAGVQTRLVLFKGGHAFEGLSTTQYLALQDLELDFIATSQSP